MPQAANLEAIFRKSLIRHYYFAEAMAVYQRFYLPLVETLAQARNELQDPGRHQDRPPTWVPLVFHCTTADEIEQIIEDGVLRPGKNGAVSFTEIPIGELDRMKYRHHEKDQIAIGFPRKYIESLQLTPAWYLKHNPEIVKILAKWEGQDPSGFARLKPYIDKNDDVSPFQEIRTAAQVNMEQAVWLLTTHRSKKGAPIVAGVKEFKAKFGRISKSYWHRSHQMGILEEWQFAKVVRSKRGAPVDFRFLGEHYWRKKTTERVPLSITLPAHSREIIFELTNQARPQAFEGPYRFLDVARVVKNTLAELGEDLDAALPHRLIANLPTS